MPSPYFFLTPRIRTVAVDLGGSWLRLAGATSKGRLVLEERRPAPPPSRLASVLFSYWQRRGLSQVERLIVGSKGIWKRAERQSLEKSLRGLAKTITVMSDGELGMYAALGRPGRPGPGVFIVAGTGAMALGLTGHGRLIRAGGLGPAQGDEGSGWWIGNQYTRRQFPRRERNAGFSLTPSGVRQTAAKATVVLTRSERDHLCAHIIREAQNHLARLTLIAGQRVQPSAPVALSWGGSLLNDLRFRKGWKALVQEMAPGRFRFVSPRAHSVRAAAQKPRLFPQGFPAFIPPRRLTTRKNRPFSQKLMA